MKIEAVSENTILLTFGDTISEAITPRIVAMEKLIEHHLAPYLVDLVPSYTTLLMIYDLDRADYRLMLSLLRKLADTLDDHVQEHDDGRTFDIPVWYDLSVGYDLENLAREKSISVDEVIHIHSSKTYRVFAVGFNPGFAFLGKVDQRIATPRHHSPRSSVAKGSVGIADAQTAIYPLTSPGGWQIIGRSPTQFFDPKGDPHTASLLQVGDEVRFKPIQKDEFLALGGQL